MNTPEPSRSGSRSPRWPVPAVSASSTRRRRYELGRDAPSLPEARTAQGVAGGEPAPERVAQGKQAVGALKRQLVGALTEALKNGPPSSAITVCSGVAPGVAAVAQRRAASPSAARRASRATPPTRRPAGARTRSHTSNRWWPPAGRSTARRGARGSPAADRLRRAAGHPGRCASPGHGAAGPEVQAELASRYPSDQATGYEAGDLRGVAWAEIASAAVPAVPPAHRGRLARRDAVCIGARPPPRRAGATGSCRMPRP